ncbi:hypothetical protein NDU88_005292 [Pleurodeles waltl]|uniref:Uncharacterized protein n=1 Tax=Pleurodeles waltl TaxID=8319 RepID=A0AAV7LWZ5_PLEWA|nr:hypothetical protein NDU88_005292 [Pleurodeles waltl]
MSPVCCVVRARHVPSQARPTTAPTLVGHTPRHHQPSRLPATRQDPPLFLLARAASGLPASEIRLHHAVSASQQMRCKGSPGLSRCRRGLALHPQPQRGLQAAAHGGQVTSCSPNCDRAAGIRWRFTPRARPQAQCAAPGGRLGHFQRPATPDGAEGRPLVPAPRDGALPPGSAANAQKAQATHCPSQLPSRWGAERRHIGRGVIRA